MSGKRNIKIKPLLCIFLVLSMMFVPGCWDRVEVNDIALIMASAFDLAPDGKVQGTSQVMLPIGQNTGASEAGAGTKQGRDFVVKTAIGIDPGDAQGKIQKMFSRRLFRGHRRVIVIGEELARHGVGELLDSISRDPQNRLRTDILVAKGKKGYDLLNIDYPMERVPAEAMREMINTGAGVEVTIRNFLIKASGEGVQPIATVIEPEEGEEGFKLNGVAVFKDLKLVGYLDSEETTGYLWIVGELKKGVVTAAIPGVEGVVSIDLTSSKSKINPEVNGDKVKFYIELKGEGDIHGNSTKLDFSIPKNVELAEEAAKAEIKKQAEKTIKAVQKEYNSDILGFGSVINEGHPDEWKKLKDKWDEVFPNAEVSVSVDFNIRQTGMSGPPLHLKEDEVKK